MPRVGPLAAWALAGWASAPGFSREEPGLSPLAQSTRDKGEYWRSLGDTTLVRLLEEALDANLDLRAAEARIRGARASKREATLDFAPTVIATAGYTRQRIAGASFPIGSGSFPDQNIWDAGFDAIWEVDVFGRLRERIWQQIRREG